MTAPIQVRSFDVTTPAATLQASPLTTGIVLPTMQVSGITIRVPAGPSGMLGLRILYSGVVVVPFQSSDWIVADDEVLNFPLTDLPTAGAWSMQTYNIGRYSHTVYIRFLLAPVTTPPGPPVVPISASVIETIGG